MKILKMICKYAPFAAGALLSACKGEDVKPTNHKQQEYNYIYMDIRNPESFQDQVRQATFDRNRNGRVYCKYTQDSKDIILNETTVAEWDSILDEIQAMEVLVTKHDGVFKFDDTLYVNRDNFNVYQKDSVGVAGESNGLGTQLQRLRHTGTKVIPLNNEKVR